MRIKAPLTLALIVVTCLALATLPSCGSDDGQDDVQPTPTLPVEDEITFTIGNITDMTGQAANSMKIIDMALQDLVRYYNEENLIPGVELEVLSYDTSYDPSNDVPAYEWLKERGADMIWTGIPATPTTLRTRLDQDRMLLFAAGPSMDALMPPGYVFNPTTMPEDNAYTLLKWLAENDWDYRSEGPAKVGGAGWTTPYNVSTHGAMEEYCEAHPEQFEWVGGYRAEFVFTWGPEAEKLKDCDYVVTPVLLVNFVRDYRNAGYQAKFLGTGSQVAFLGMIRDAGLWEELDGGLFILPAGYWTDDTEMIQMVKDILYRYHRDEADEIMRDGSYIAVDGLNQMLEIIGNAAEAAGPANLDSEALYAAATSYSQSTGGLSDRATFTATKRTSINYLAVYEARAAQENLYRVHEEWYPILMQPRDL